MKGKKKNKKKVKKVAINNYVECEQKREKCETEETVFWLSIVGVFVFSVLGGGFYKMENIPASITFFVLAAISTVVIAICMFSGCNCEKK